MHAAADTLDEEAEARRQAREELARQKDEEVKAAAEATEEQAAEAARAARQREAERQKFYQDTNVWLWPEPDAAAQAKALAEEKQFLRTVVDAFPMLPLRLYETEYFLFLSDMPPAQVALYTPYLDAMYREPLQGLRHPRRDEHLARAEVPGRRLPRRAGVSHLRAAVLSGARCRAHGIAHTTADGRVVIACFRGDDVAGFGRMVVHETAHGFLHRYKSSADIPSWVHEGIADWISMLIVRADDEVQFRQKRSIEIMRRTRSLGGNFFTAANIADWQYGTASSMTEFLLRLGKERYKRFIDEMKLGHEWPEALATAYGLTPETFLAQYGQFVGAPGCADSMAERRGLQPAYLAVTQLQPA